jgi:orotate phosphoribosyltransferase
VLTLPARIRNAARLSGRFVLRSGAASDTYFDKYQFEADPELLRDIALAMCRLIPKETEVLAGLEMGGIPIVTMLSQITGLPAAFIRKQPKEYGTCRYAEGTSLKNKVFIVIEDVVSSGGAILDSLGRLKTDGLMPIAAVCVIDRQTGGVQALAKNGMELRALYTFEEIEQSGG